MSKVNIIMDRVNIPYKIHFHKQVSDVLYFDLLSYFLNKSKLENKVSKLEEHIKREKTMSKSWKSQIKTLEADLVVVGGKFGEKNQLRSC